MEYNLEILQPCIFFLHGNKGSEEDEQTLQSIRTSLNLPSFCKNEKAPMKYENKCLLFNNQGVNVSWISQNIIYTYDTEHTNETAKRYILKLPVTHLRGKSMGICAHLGGLHIIFKSKHLEIFKKWVNDLQNLLIV